MSFLSLGDIHSSGGTSNLSTFMPCIFFLCKAKLCKDFQSDDASTVRILYPPMGCKAPTDSVHRAKLIRRSFARS